MEVLKNISFSLFVFCCLTEVVLTTPHSAEFKLQKRQSDDFYGSTNDLWSEDDWEWENMADYDDTDDNYYDDEDYVDESDQYDEPTDNNNNDNATSGDNDYNEESEALKNCVSQQANIKDVRDICADSTSHPRSLPVLPHCGEGRVRRSLHMRKRIIGGVESTHGDWPWLAALGPKDSARGWEVCGATLISKDWLVTAAHCFDDSVKDPCRWNVRLGEHNKVVDTNTEQDIRISKIIKHPDYDEKTLENDIALIKLSSPAQLNDYVNVACLPDVTDLYSNGQTGYAAGWGLTTNGGKQSDVLRHVGLRRVPREECELSYPGLLHPDKLCAGYKGSGKDTCTGDSGGGLYVRGADGKHIFHGLVSGGAQLCGNEPGIFVSVKFFMCWIEESIRAN